MTKGDGDDGDGDGDEERREEMVLRRGDMPR